MKMYKYLQPGLQTKESVELLEKNFNKFKIFIGCGIIKVTTFDELYNVLVDGIHQEMTDDILDRNVEPFLVMLYKNEGRIANTITPYATKPHEQYAIDIAFNNGFDVTTLDYLKECLSSTDTNNIDLGAIGKGGIHDDRFGPHLKLGRNQIDFTYSCECGDLYGIGNLGVICSVGCRKPVKKNEFPLTKRGWITLPHDMAIPTYRGSVYLNKLFSDNDMAFILGDSTKIDANRDKTSSDSTKSTQTKAKEVNNIMRKALKMGGDFMDCVLAVYNSDLGMGYKTANAKQAMDILLNNKDTFFSNRFPVISTALRRSYAMKKQVVGTAEIALCDLDKGYIKVLDAASSSGKKLHTNLIKNIALSTYRRAILGAMDVYEMIINDTGAKDPKVTKDVAKKKHIQAQTFSRRQSNTVMSVMTVKETFTMSNTIGVSYRMFITLYYDKLKSYINNPIKAKKLLNTNIDPKRVSKETKIICDNYIRLFTCPVMVNRQPTLTRGSNIACYVGELHNDEVIKLPPIIYKALNADVDGDKPSLKAIDEKVYGALNAIFSPCDGALDNYGNPTKQNRMAREYALNALLITGDE